MKTGIGEALILSAVMAIAIFFCRIFPFLFFRKKTGAAPGGGATDHSAAANRGLVFLNFVEKTVPPAAMTVLAFNSLAAPAKVNPRELIPSITAAIITAVLHLWRKNPLISIFGGTALYMALLRVVG